MKNNKNWQLLALFVTVIGLIMIMYSFVFDLHLIVPERSIILGSWITAIASINLFTYVLSIAKRVNPKQYIYVSYTRADKEIADFVIKTLAEQLNKLSKYHYEILSADSVPYGADMLKTVSEYLEKSTVIVVVVSKDYIESNWCNKEFISFYRQNKQIIPIVVDSYRYLSEMPEDISHIKALSLRDCSEPDEFKRRITSLTKEMIKHRHN